LETAVGRGLVPRERSHELSHDQRLMLICKPGFSMSEQVTDVSGRGVGMNAVKRQVEALQGAIEIETQSGQGTTFRLLVPLSLALTQALIVQVGDETYAVPLHYVEQTIEVDPERVQRLHRWQMLQLNDAVLPIFDLGKLLGAANGAHAHNREALVVRRGGQRLGLVVDDLLDKQEIVVKPLPQSLIGLPGLSGTTILGAGQVVLILDVPNLVQGLV
jgi:two-component system chemotaxis sensor kinase CheA